MSIGGRARYVRGDWGVGDVIRDGRGGGTYDVHCCAEYVDEVLVGDGGGGEEEVVGYCYVEDGDYAEEEGG